MTDVTIRGFEEIVQKLDKLPENIQKAVQAGVFAGAVHIMGKVSKYPPATVANTPFQRRWYERGWGEKWMLRDGSWHGRHSSETLGRNWSVEVRNKNEYVIGNNASYGPYVQGGADAIHPQAQALKRIGWKTTDQIKEEESDKVIEFVQRQIEKALAK